MKNKSTLKIKIVPILLLITMAISVMGATTAFADESTPTPEATVTEAVATEDVSVTEDPAVTQEVTAEALVTEEVVVTEDLAVNPAPNPAPVDVPEAPATPMEMLKSFVEGFSSSDIGSESGLPPEYSGLDANGNNNVSDECSQSANCIPGTGDADTFIIVSSTPLDALTLKTGVKYGYLHYFDLDVDGTCNADSLYCAKETIDPVSGNYVYEITRINGQDISNAQGWVFGDDPEETPTGTDTITPTGTDTITPTGTDTITPTGTDTITPTGTDTITPTGTDTITPTGTDTITPTGTDTITPTGTDTGTPGTPGTPENPGTPVDPGTQVSGATPIVAPTVVPKTGAADMAGGFTQFIFSLLGMVGSGFGLFKPKFWIF